MSWTKDIPSALAFALDSHTDQKYGELPYMTHLTHVVLVLLRFGFDPSRSERCKNLVMAGYLHDTLEDTEATREELEEFFGKEVADLVHAVTDEAGKNRRERHAKTYPKTRELPDAVLLKLADRIANVEHSRRGLKEGERAPRGSLLRMYHKEHLGFREALYQKGEADEMWLKLEGLLAWVP